MAAIAVHDALLKACALQTDIKWPNDILVNGRKLCGILAETIDTDRAVILGIGINLTNAAFPPELRDTATSVDAASGKSVSVEGLLQALITSLEWHYQILQSPNGVEETIQKWSERSSYAEGKKIVVSNGNEIVEGTTCGLESDGALRLETADGEIKIVGAGGVNAGRTTKKQHECI